MMKFRRKMIWNEGFSFVFFFQAEAGIRSLTVTGVQTCALPIFLESFCDVGPAGEGVCRALVPRGETCALDDVCAFPDVCDPDERRCVAPRSEERRVGKECRYRCCPFISKTNDEI